ncbi:MAG: hypothetical protein WB810_09650 [Candidatus Cybelea sp.]
MSLELWNTFATYGTFLVIAATALAAIVQLRQLRGSNQIAALYKVRETSESRELRDAQHFVFTELAEKMKDPAFRYQVQHRAARTNENQASIAKIVTVGNFWESMGTLVKTGLLDKNLVFEAWSGHVADDWEKLASVTALWRRTRGTALMENFEYLTVLSKDWVAAYPNGTYPARVRRIDLKDDWLKADTQYEASLASL